MSDDTAGNRIESKNPRDAFTNEHQRMAWEIAAWAVERAHRIVTMEIKGTLHEPGDLLAWARLAQQIATGAL